MLRIRLSSSGLPYYLAITFDTGTWCGNATESTMSSNSHNSSSEEGAARHAQPRPFFIADTREHAAQLDPSSDSEKEQLQTRERANRHRSWMKATPPSPSRPPPSSFSFPFQAYPGNPDPGLSIPGFRALSRRYTSDDDATSSSGTNRDLIYSASLSDLSRPQAPFMMSASPIFRGSAAGSLNVASTAPGDSGAHIPRSSSVQTFRPPFLSPASRPSSSVWTPPTPQLHLTSTGPSSPSASFAVLPYALPKSKPPLPSTRIAAPIPVYDKPWLSKKEPGATLSYLITVICMLLGIGGAAVICWRGFASVQKLDPSNLCLVLDENFDGTSLDQSVWSYDVELGGFG